MILLSTSSLAGYGLHRQFLLAKEAGFDAIDLSLSFPHFDEWAWEYVASLVEWTHISVASITAPEHDMTQEALEKIILLAEKLQAKRINFFPPSRKDREDRWFFSSLPEFAKSNPPMELLVTNVEPKTLLFFVPEYKDATLPAIKKITGKTTFSLSSVDPSSGVDLHKSLSLLGNTICNVFVADRSGGQENLLPGSGDMPLASIIAKLKQNGFAGDYTLRVDSSFLVSHNEKDTLQKLIAAKEFIQTSLS